MTNSENSSQARPFAKGDRVRQTKGADVGAIGTITVVVPHRTFFSDGSGADGEVRVTFEGIRYPNVRYRLGQEHLSLALIEPAA